MNALTDTLRQLVRRRLWPVAILLLAGLVAVPLVLAKNPEPAPAPPVAASVKTAPETTSYVKLVADEGDNAKRRRVLGAEKDPFEPAPLPKPKKKKKKQQKAAEPAQAQAAAEATATPEASAAPSTDAPSPAPAAPVATPAPKSHPKGSLKIRFGKVGGTMKTSTLERLKALPSSSSPVLVFTGLQDHGKTAVFMLSGDVKAEGDGSCDPSGDSCQTLELRAGDTEFLTVAGTGSTDGQYELDLELIH
jgi:hypothetical protein